MKKTALIILAAAVCICFAACSNSTEETEYTEKAAQVQTTQDSTETTQRVTSTASPTVRDDNKAKQLEKAVSSAIPTDCSANADGTGGFELTLDKTDEAEMYSMEQSDDMQEKAEKNAADFAAAMESFYPYEISYEATQAQQIGGSDNGIDSAVYIITYTNMQNQELSIKADSTGEIYYVFCNFTW